MLVARFSQIEHALVFSIDEAVHWQIVLTVKMEPAGNDDLLQRRILDTA